MNRPRTFTAAEQVMEELSDMILSCGETYEQLAQQVGCSKGTLQRVASRQTKWPRPTTLFPLMAHFGAGFQIANKED